MPGSWRGRIEQSERFGKHATPQQRLCMQQAESPGPFRIGTLEALRLPFGQLLALFKVALTESLAGLVKKNLRANLLTTGEPAQKRQE